MKTQVKGMVSALSAGAESQQAAHGVMQSLQVADGAAAPGGFHPAGISLFHPQQAATSQMQKAKKTKWFYKAHPLCWPLVPFRKVCINKPSRFMSWKT